MGLLKVKQKNRGNFKKYVFEIKHFCKIRTK